MSNFRFDGLLSPNAGMFFEKELRSIRKEILEDQRAPLNGMELIPQGDDVEPWANTYEHQMYEMIGVAEFISDYSEDLPLVDVAARQEVFNAREFGCAYKFSLDEIEKSAALGKGLDRKRTRAAMVAIDEKFNRIQFFGDTATQLFGWLNYPYIPRRIISFPFDDSSSSLDILSEVNAMMFNPWFNTSTVAQPDTLVMAPELYAYISTTPWSKSSNGATDMTILTHFKTNNPMVKEVKAARELSNAGPNGEHLMVAYKKDPLIFEHKLIRPFTQEAPQNRSLSIITNCRAKSGGVASDRPLEMLIGEVPAAA